MKPLKVMTVVGTRPEIIRLSEVIKAIDAAKETFSQVLVHTGQNYDYELNEIFFDDLGLRKPDIFLSAAGETALSTIGNILIKIEKVLDEVKPDLFLVLGDTNSALCALAAKRKKVPVFHMEAGNRSFDERVPEEINRKIVDHIADINLPYSTLSRQYLLREGLPSDRIIKTGSPMKEVIEKNRKKIDASPILKDLSLKANQYFVISAHREENINETQHFQDFIATLNMLAKDYQQPIIVSTHPRTKNMIDSKAVQVDPLVRLLKPLKFSDYVHLQLHARVVLSDSGTINEETSNLGLRALNIRDAHERPEAMEEASTPLVGLKPEKIKQGISLIESTLNQRIKPVADYDIDNVSNKVVRLLLSYYNYQIPKK
ncbi:MAG: non-hydrolyzing UDP-N-acetylglucosamine 2-epimerase [Bacilli bacterium]